MNAREQITGTREEHYNLISVLYHALHGAENCEIYALDAEEDGNDDLAAFFRNAQSMQRHLAEQAKERLDIGDIVTPKGIVTPETAEVGTEVPRGTTPPHDAIPPRAPTGEVPPGDILSETMLVTPATEEGVDVAPPGRGTIPPEAPRTRDVQPRPGEPPA